MVSMSISINFYELMIRDHAIHNQSIAKYAMIYNNDGMANVGNIQYSK